jgi:hypothetical protein
MKFSDHIQTQGIQAVGTVQGDEADAGFRLLKLDRLEFHLSIPFHSP